VGGISEGGRSVKLPFWPAIISAGRGATGGRDRVSPGAPRAGVDVQDAIPVDLVPAGLIECLEKVEHRARRLARHAEVHRAAGAVEGIAARPPDGPES